MPWIWCRWCRCWTPICRPSPTLTRQWLLPQVIGAATRLPRMAVFPCGCTCSLAVALVTAVTESLACWSFSDCVISVLEPKTASGSQMTSLAPRTARPRARRARATGTRSSRPTRLRPRRKRGWPAPRWLARPGLPCMRLMVFCSMARAGHQPAAARLQHVMRQCTPCLHDVLARRCEAADKHACATAAPSARAGPLTLRRSAQCAVVRGCTHVVHPTPGAGRRRRRRVWSRCSPSCRPGWAAWAAWRTRWCAPLPAGRGARWGMEDRVGLQVAFGEEALEGAQLKLWLDSALPQVRTMAAARHTATLLS